MSSQPAAQPSDPVSTFDPEIFWALHKQKILIGAVLLLAALLGSSLYFGFQAIQSQKAEAAYAAADSVEGWQAVIRQFPDSIAAGNSYLRIAVKLRDDGKYQESDERLRLVHPPISKTSFTGRWLHGAGRQCGAGEAPRQSAGVLQGCHRPIRQFLPGPDGAFPSGAAHRGKGSN